MTVGLRVPVALLRRQGAAPREVRAAAVLDGMRIGTVGVDGDEVVLDFEVGVSGMDIVASGTVDVDWTGECRRCLEPVHGHLRAEVREVFRAEDPLPAGDAGAGDTYPLESDAGEQLIDLGVVARDAVLLALPLSPLCGEDCVGPDPERFPAMSEEDVESGEGTAGPERDPRWAALDVLREPGDDG
ncbi:MAG: DUF177 domain-containing protein [Acidimicrobiales bacterium]|nr:DUF177 domain-containing protein [Acidimicrobiales bacterium]